MDVVDTGLKFFGLIVAVAAAFASTSFVANAMAGLMLRRVKNFRPGDYLSVGDYFGRVSEQGVFHIELQSEDSDLVTVPNMYMVTNPVKVVRGTGTIVSATVSLGYDVAHSKVFSLLLDAAREANLTDCFVQITELGDSAVNYRVAGTLEDTSVLVSTRSKLRACMLGSLHRAGVEVASPAIVGQRRLPKEEKILPPVKKKPAKGDVFEDGRTPEEVMFTKAIQADHVERLQDRITKLEAEIEKLNSSAADGVNQEQIEVQVRWREAMRQRTNSELEALQGELETVEEE